MLQALTGTWQILLEQVAVPMPVAEVPMQHWVRAKDTDMQVPLFKQHLQIEEESFASRDSKCRLG